MHKTYKYTIVTLLLAVAFSLGSMEAMKLILWVRERQILSENGKIEVAEPVQERQKQGTITVEDIEEAVSRWKGEMLSVHNPYEGQISMEDAIRAGREWMSEMDMENSYLYGREKDKEERIYSVQAVLGVMAQEESAEDDVKLYDSFWRVGFTSRSMRVLLYVNAVTGRVWSADITMYRNLPEQMPYWQLKTFVELSGLEPSYKGSVRNQEGTEAVWDIEDSRLCARMEFNKKDDADFGDSVTEPDDGIPHEKSVHMEIKLAIEEDD